MEAGQPWLHDLVTVLSAPTMALTGQDGQLRRSGAQGVFHANARVLSQAILEVDGAEPVPVSSGPVSAGPVSAGPVSAGPVSAGPVSASTAVFAGILRRTVADAADPAVWLTRQRTVRPGIVTELLRVHGGPRAAGDARVTLRVAADLAVLTDVKAGRSGPLTPMTAEGAGAVLRWGDGLLRAELHAPGAEVVIGENGEAELAWQVRLASQSRQEIRWQLTVQDTSPVVMAPPGEPVIRVPRARSGEPAPAGRGGDGPWARVRAQAADPRLPRLLARSLGDAAALRMVTARAPGDVFLGAGAPWYLTLFGRDSIWAARLLLPFGWDLAAGTLRALAAFQGQRVDHLTGEAPGKIPHELRPTRRTVQRPDALPPLYYGTIDATPLWVCLLRDAWRWGMPAGEVRALLPCLKDALGWMRDYGDADGDGLLEYQDHSGRGLANQGWKDSRDAVRFADGRIASPPVTLCEAQGYAHEAALAGADLLDAFGEPGAARWRAWAARLAGSFRSSFWVADSAGAYPALALDGSGRRVDALASNISHLLGTGLLTAQEEAAVAGRLSGPGMNSGFGLRTMSAASGGYSPLSYHCGSVWSHDTAIAILGLARSGHPEVAASLADGLLDAAAAFGWRLPELFSGQGRADLPRPSPYPPACQPQAWAAAAAGALVQAMLGLDVDVPAAAVRICPPAGAGQLRVDGLVAGQETFSAGVDAGGAGYVSGLAPASGWDVQQAGAAAGAAEGEGAAIG